MEVENRWNTRRTADYLAVEPGTLRMWRVKGIGPPYIKLSPGKVVYDPDDVRQWESQRRRLSTSQH